jgi:hypothetical protein
MKKLLAILAASSVLLVGCLGGVKDEKQAFIDATVEATCLVFQSDNIFDPALEGQAKEIYKKYGFDADDDAAMEALTSKYEGDEEVQAAITKALEECAGDFSAALEDAFGEMEFEDAEMPVEDSEVLDEEVVAE